MGRSKSKNDNKKSERVLSISTTELSGRAMPYKIPTAREISNTTMLSEMKI